MNDISRKLAERLKPGAREESKGIGDAPRVYMFFSADLVNFTRFKAGNRNWPQVLAEFYGSLVANVGEKYSKAKVRKYIGDEVLFHIEAGSIEEIAGAPAALHEAMMLAQSDVRLASGSALRLKGALWLARVAHAGNKAGHGECEVNFLVNLPVGKGEAEIIIDDFIGVDIDEGFRMSENSSQGKMALDPKIACLLAEKGGVCASRAGIVGYSLMKGVWHDCAYPVIWYAGNWDADNPQDVLLYDEHLTNGFALNLLKGSVDVGSLERIHKIFASAEWARKSLEAIKDILETTETYAKPKSAAARDMAAAKSPPEE